MKTFRIIQAMLPGLLFPLISFAGENIHFPNNLSEYIESDVSNVKDTIEIIISDDNKILLIADSLDVFNDISIDSVFQVVKQEMKGNFTNTSGETITKRFTLDSISNSPIKPDSSNMYRTLSLSIDVLAGLIKNDL